MTFRPSQPHSWHNSGHEPHSGIYHQTQQHQRSTRNAAHYWARVDLPTPDQSPPWPQCDGLTVRVTLCFQPYSTFFFNPMSPMGLSRGPQTNPTGHSSPHSDSPPNKPCLFHLRRWTTLLPIFPLRVDSDPTAPNQLMRKCSRLSATAVP